MRILEIETKKFIPLIILAAFMFPVPLTYLMTTPSIMERYTDKADAFDGLFNMVLVKILVLFLFGIIFCVASTIATILCGVGTLEVYGIGYKLFLAVETGIFITAGTLPLILLVVFFSKTYIFSILLCVFYSVLNMSATALFDALPQNPHF